jgi:hypothetical protein
MYDKFYRLTGEVDVRNPFTAQVQRHVRVQLAPPLLIQNPTSLHKLQGRILTEFVRSEAESVHADIWTQDVWTDPIDRRIRLDLEPAPVPLAFFQPLRYR